VGGIKFLNTERAYKYHDLSASKLLYFRNGRYWEIMSSVGLRVFRRDWPGV